MKSALLVGRMLRLPVSWPFTGSGTATVPVSDAVNERLPM